MKCHLVRRLLLIAQRGWRSRFGKWQRRALAFLLTVLLMVSSDLGLGQSGLAQSRGAGVSRPDATTTILAAVEPLTIDGRLDQNSEVLEDDNSYYDRHTFAGIAGQAVAIELVSSEFDAYLVLLDPSGNKIAENDDGNDGTNSLIAVTLPATGTYIILAKSYAAAETGSYTLTIRAALQNDFALAEAARLNQQVLQFHNQGRYADALPLAQRTLEIREQILGANHPDVATGLNNLASLYEAQGNYAQAEPLYQRSLSIREAALGDNHPDVATSLNNLALLYLRQGNYAQAELLLQRSLSILEAALGANHSNVGTILHNLAGLYQTQGNYAQAESLYQRSLSIQEVALGTNHPDVGRSLNNLAELYRAQGNYAQAEPLYQRSLSIREAALGNNHPDVATSLNNLALLYLSQGNYAQAELLSQRSLSIREAALGNNHPDVATSLSALAALYQDQGNYAQAEPLYQRSLSILQTALGDNHPDVGTSLNNLAGLYEDQGNYAQAEPLYQRSLSIREAALGENHPDVGTSLNNLAGLYQDQGNYAQAESLYQRSLSILEATLGDNHPDVGTSLNNLAGLYQDQGNYAQAESLYQRSLSIREAALRENHPDVATSLNNLALLYLRQGNYAQAELLLQRSLSISEAALGANHPNVASILSSLAGLHEAQGNYAQEEPLYQRSLSIREAALGANHPDVATSLNNLAALYQEQGDYAQAEPLYQRSVSIYEAALGANHPDVAISLNNLATLYQAQGNTTRALTWLRRSMDVEETNLALTFSIGSEARKRAYIATLQGSSNYAISLHLQAETANLEAAKLALTTVLRRKGRVLDAVTSSLQTLRQNLTPQDQELLDQLQTTRTQLTVLLFGGLGDRSPDQYRTQVAALQTQAEQLENQLAQRSAEFRVETQPVTIEATQALIPADTALVELVQYEPFNPRANRSEQWGTPHYAAYVLHRQGDPQWADLGEAEAIDQLVTRFREDLGSKNAAIQQSARALDAKLMQPVRSLLNNSTQVLISPDSQLNLIPFAALVDENNRYLLETYTFTYLTSGRDLLKLQLNAPSREAPVVFANPDYQNSGNSEIASVVATRPLTARPQTRRSTQRSDDLSTLHFADLQGTQLEADAIAPLLSNVTVLTRSQATENTLKHLQAPSILHLATHGFFLEDVEFVPPPDTRSDGTVTAVFTGDRPAPNPNIRRSNENPLLRSGLALAGFNNRQGGGDEDGVLTALEVSNLDLYGTQLVVMSACETGLGDVINGEGVYGLRRAFVMAGAESQLMSLWNVADYETSSLMTDYYQKIQDGMGRSEALRRTQLTALQPPLSQHPFYWAAFIFSGDWSPMTD